MARMNRKNVKTVQRMLTKANTILRNFYLITIQLDDDNVKKERVH